MKKKFTRKSTKKFFSLRWNDLIGENIFSGEDIGEKFNISQTVFLNQILRKKNHFLDSQEISHKIIWKSPEFEFFIDKLRENQRDQKIIQKFKGKKRPNHTRNHNPVFQNHKDLVDIIEKV